MSISLDGYKLTRLLRSSGSSQVWQGERLADHRPIVAKVFAIENPKERVDASVRASNRARVDHEFELIRRLDVPGVVQALALEQSGDQLILILEAHRGLDLGELLRHGPLTIDRFLDIAIGVTRILADVHERRVLHRDIKPANILIDPDSAAVVLADFGISELLASERSNLHDPHLIEGTLPYLAPEQSGRTARGVDFRSDLYSLGVTFYEALVGRRPFAGAAPLELIHAHLARRPTPPRIARPELPRPLDALIMKLLEKAPERRYQSARGLCSDLIAIRDALRSNRDLGEIELGRADVPLVLQPPRQLYGRAREREALLAAFRRAHQQHAELVVISGAPGVGKSALVRELDEPLLATQGFLLRGSHAEESEQPLEGLLAALTSFGNQLLTLSPEALERWRQLLRARLGELAPVLTELVPPLQLVLRNAAHEGVPTKLEGLRTAVEARNQAMLACVRLLTCIARAEHPLVLVLDDVQWADTATFELLRELLREHDAALLVVLLARPAALEPGQALRALLAEFDTVERSYELLALGELEREALLELVADMLSRPRASVDELAELVARKTGSNPYFAVQLLLHLADRQLLRRESEGWAWELAALEAAKLPDDVLAMMMGKLELLAGDDRRLLQVASVIGERFEVGLLVCASGLADAASRLPGLLDQGLIGALAHEFAFSHEAIRAAAYASLEPDERARIHLAIGRELLRTLDRKALDQRVFELVEHLDRGYRLDDAAGVAALADVDQIEVAELNLRAGQRALVSGAPESAASYLEVARRTLAPKGTPRPGQHALHVEIELASARADVLTGRPDAALARLTALSERALDAEPLGRVTETHVWALTVSGRFSEGLRIALAGLRRLGFTVPRWPTRRHMLMGLLRLTTLTTRRSLEHLRTRPPVQDPARRAALDILLRVAPTTYMVSAEAFITMIVLHAELLRGGLHRSSALVVAQLGMIGALVFDRQRRALEFGKAALELCETIESTPLHVEQATIFMRMWSEPYVGLLGQLGQLFERSLEQGQRELAETIWVMRMMLGFYGGQHLRLVESTVELRSRFPVSANHSSAQCVIMACRSLIEGPIPSSFDDTDGSDEERRVRSTHTRTANAVVLAVFGRWKDVQVVLEGMPEQAERAAGRIWFVPMLRLLSGVADAVVARTRVGVARRRLVKRVRASLHRLARWNAHGANHHCHEAALRGELAALDGDLAAAIAHFDRARELAANLRSPLLEGLVSERLAAILLEHDRSRLAFGLRVDARDRYQHWGAFAKVAQLEQRWPELAWRRGAPERAGASTTTGGLSLVSTSTGSTSSSTTNHVIDSATLLKASQMLGEDIQLGEVVTRVLDIALENAGAGRGVVLLAKHAQLELVAESSAEGPRRSLEQPIPLRDAGERLASTVVRWAERTTEPVVLNDAAHDPRFASDPYLRGVASMSILCLPFVKHGRLVGLLYLENELSTGSFSPERLELLRVLTAQTASALENARLYDELRTSESRWRSLVEQLPDFVLLVDRSGAIEYINLGTRARSTPHPRVDPGMFALGPAAADIQAALGRVFVHASSEQLEFPANNPSGEQRWYAVRIGPIRDESRIDKALVVATDITERKRAELQREQLETQLRQQQRLESIGTLASGVAHEINNPIQGIMNYAELIAGSEDASADIREFAGEIEVETQRVTTIVRNLLAFSRQELEEALEPVSVDEIIEGTLSLIRTVLRRDQITLDIAIPSGLPKLSCRRQQIQQIIMNLVTNARDALNERWSGYHVDKRIRIRAEVFEHEGRGWLRLRVEDEGGGVPVHVVPRIFDPFFTTKGRDKGTGLGLAVSHGIVREHGGVLRLDNHPGKGACFSLELPLEAARATA
jgi:predicted ATPase/signal transduction histidine kinase/tRNA A-37 threonylcarbamoyl transferase component Bud32